MRQAPKSTDRRRSRVEHASAGNEPARFLRNLTSLPDTEFASTYSPAIAAVLAHYRDLPDPAAARRELLLALKAALKRRRAFILPRFTQAEDSWRIRECATYAVAIAVLVEHGAATLAPERDDQAADPDAWTRLLADPETDPDDGGSGPRDALFHAIVPARGRRWIAREPLVRTLLVNYFTDTAPNELHEIVAPVVAGFEHERQASTRPRNDDPPASLPVIPDHPAKPAPPNRPRLLERALAWARGAFGRSRRPIASHRSLREEPVVTHTALAEHGSTDDATAAPKSTPPAQRADPTRLPTAESATNTPALAGRSPLHVAAPSSPPTLASAEIQTRSPRASNTPAHRRRGGHLVDLLQDLPAAPASAGATALPDSPSPLSVKRRDIGDHGAAAPRIGHAADYARSLMAENALRPTSHGESFVLPGPAPGTTRQPLDIDALFPARVDPVRLDARAIAAWIAFRDHLVEALRSGAQSANGERSLVHLLDVGVFLVWPHIVLPFNEELRLAPHAIKTAMRTAGVLAVNRADRQDDPHTFPALTGDPTVTYRGLVTLPEYLWPDASRRPIAPSTFVSPPAIYGQRYRRPH